MLVLSMDGLDDFLEVTNFVHSRNKYYNTVDFKCSQAMLSMTVSRRSPRCVIELQTMPQFFTLFFCDQISHSTVSIHEFFTTLFDMKRSGFYLMIFSLTEPLGHLHLTFITYSGDDRCEAYVPLLLPFEEADPALINYGTFVSILSQEFLRIAVILNLPYVFVTLTNSQVKFDVGTREGFTLTEEKGECIIGGVAEGDEIQFAVVLNPIESFYSLIGWSNSRRVWLFKSNDNFHGIITIPIGLYAQYLVYSPGISS